VIDGLLKVIIFGDDGVGKTTLETHLVPLFDPQNSMEDTIGVSLHTLIVEVKGFRLKLQIWLMSNKERFFKDPISRMQLNGSNSAILLYDITNPSSLRRVPEWFERLEERCGNIPILLVGNKIDEEKQRAISKTRAVDVKEKYNLASYLEISAKTGTNVKKMFERVVKLMLKNYHRRADKGEPTFRFRKNWQLDRCGKRKLRKNTNRREIQG